MLCFPLFFPEDASHERGPGSEAAILAFALTFPVALTLARMPLGLLYIRDLAALRSGMKLRAD